MRNEFSQVGKEKKWENEACGSVGPGDFVLFEYEL